MYLTRENSIKALQKMQVFHSNLCEMYLQHGMNLKSNLGRSNFLQMNYVSHFPERQVMVGPVSRTYSFLNFKKNWSASLQHDTSQAVHLHSNLIQCRLKTSLMV